jgi:hypothetical protein
VKIVRPVFVVAVVAFRRKIGVVVNAETAKPDCLSPAVVKEWR